jgi:multidrug efflux system membrane fusion protein
MTAFTIDSNRFRFVRRRLNPFWLALALMLLFGCTPQEKTQKAVAAVPVTTAQVVEKDVPVLIQTTGTADAYAVVNVTSRVDGQLVKVHFKEGQEVKKGELLFTIDDRPFVVALDAAESNLQKDRVRLDKANRDALRNGELAKKDYITRDQYEQALTDAQALKATVAADKAAVENARLNLSYCTIAAPIDARAGSLRIDSGNLVKANDTRPLVVLQQIRPMFVKFSIPEQYLSQIRSQMAKGPLVVTVSVPGSDALVRRGRLAFMENSVDIATGTIALKAVFDNTDSGLWPGQFLNVVLVLGHRPKALVIPTQAIQKGQQGASVFVVDSHLRVSVRQIEPGLQYDGSTVVEKGLKAGETVVVDGQIRLFPGAKVAVKDPFLSSGAAGS